MTIDTLRNAAPTAAAPSVVSSMTFGDRMLALRDRLIAGAVARPWLARLPLVGLVARRQSQSLFDLCAGFVYSQVLTACVRSGLLDFVAAEPRTVAAIAAHCALPLDGAERLVRAATAMQLLGPRSGTRHGLGATGVAVRSAPGLVQMIEHNVLLYDDLRDPIAVLRGDATRAHRSREVGSYFGYATTESPETLSAQAVAPYSTLMSETVAPIAAEVLDAVPLDGRRLLMDVGGGTGAFVCAVAARHPSIALRLFDLPAVASLAADRVAREGLASRIDAVGGDFHSDALPTGADVITFVRVLLDHDDASVRALLGRARAALAPGGMVVIAEPMAGAKGAAVVGDVYFALYLRAMGRGRPREAGELGAMLRDAGFRDVRSHRTRYPVFAGILTARA